MQNTNTSLTYCLTTVGLDKSIGRAFLIFPAPHGPDRTRLRQMNKMARHKRCQRLQSATKWFETLRPKSTFWRFPDFERGKDSFSSPIPSMQCCATVRATFRKQETSQLWMEGTGEGVWILMFSEVTLFEYNVSTILSPIVWIAKVATHPWENEFSSCLRAGM